MSDIQFSELLNEWLLSQKGIVKDGTYYSYKSRITSMIESILGEKNITEMTTEDILKFNNELQKNGLSVKTVKLYATVIRSAILYGAEHYGITDIMPNSLVLPKQKAVERHSLTPEEQHMWISATTAYISDR